MELVNIGYGSMISASRLIAVVSPDSAPIKRLISEARDSDHVILSGLSMEKLAPRFGVDPTVLEEEI